MSKAKAKKVMVVIPEDFPYVPDTDKPITGVKTMEFCEIGYEFTRYLEKRIDEGTVALKDVVVELCGEKDWEHFCNEYEHPETNADGFCDFILSDDTSGTFCWDVILALETDDSIMLVPIVKEDSENNDYWEVMDNLRSIVIGVCTMINNATPNSSNPIAHVKAEPEPDTAVIPMFEPVLTKL